jgi:hypothetical protein
MGIYERSPGHGKPEVAPGEQLLHALADASGATTPACLISEYRSMLSSYSGTAADGSKFCEALGRVACRLRRTSPVQRSSNAVTPY